MSVVDPSKSPSYRAQTAVQARPNVQEQKKSKALVLPDGESRNRIGIIMSVVACAAVAVFLVSRYATLVVDNYDLQQMHTTLSHQLSRNAALQSTVNELSSPTRILYIAEHVLKMQSAAPVVVGQGTK